jgi:alpha-1,2-mannosyltransferase
MLRLVWEKRPSYNHTTNLSQSSIATYFKLLYYCLFAILYGLTGSLCDMVMVNSTWTYSHISYLWRLAKNRTHVVFPPCNTDALQQLNVNNRENFILSIGQFRPEKDHSLQIRAFAKMKELVMGLPGGPELKLVLVGSCRGKEDEDRVSYLLKLAESLHIENDVVFVLNQPFSVLKDYFSRASIGLHTMWNEHFGIGVVEMMAAGLITIAHNSGGPKSDIVVPFGSERQRTGFLASTESQYVETLYDAWMIGRDHEKSLPIRLSAQQSSMRFSDHAFLSSFKSLIVEFLVQDSR